MLNRDDLYGFDSVDVAIHQTAHAYKNDVTGLEGVSALAHDMGKGRPDVLNHKINPRMEKHNLNIKEFRQILSLTKNLTPLHELNNVFNLVAITIGNEGTFNDSALLETISRFDVEKGEFMTLLTKALEDGELTEEEWYRLEKEGMDVIRAWLEVLSRCRSLVVKSDDKTVIPLTIQKES